MGFFAGVVRELDRIEDRKERRKEFMATLLEKRKSEVLPVLLEKIKENKEEADEIKAKLKTATGFGLSKKAAAVLEASGDLDILLVRLKKLEDDPENKISEAGIQRLEEAVLANVPPEKIASAMKYAFDLGYAEDPTSDKLITAIYANTEEEFQTAINPLVESATSSRSTKPTIDRFKINPMALTSLDSAKQKTVQSQIEKTLLPLLGGSYNEGQDTITWDDPTAAGIIVQNALEYFKAEATDVLSQKDEGDIYDEIFKKLRVLKTQEPNLNNIANNYPTFEFDPTEINNDSKKETGNSATEDIYDEIL